MTAPTGSFAIHIKALQTASAIEYSGHIADVIYVGGCDFRCPFCYNVDLVLHPDQMPDLQVSALLSKLKGRSRLIDGVVITGGEPTLQSGLLGLLSDLRDAGLHIKLDTNGNHPEVLADVLQKRLADYVAMDVKGSLPRYRSVAGVAVDPERLRRSISLILESGVDHEFRTTVVPGLVGEQDIAAISQEIRGARRYFLQAFRSVRTVGWGDSPPTTAPSREMLVRMAGVVGSLVDDVQIRGGD